ncbi:MAG: GTPase HflX [Phycisphaerales bacterium]
MPEPRERQNIQVRTEPTVLAAVRLPESVYDERDPFGELRDLARQAGANVVGELEQRRDRPEAGTYMGVGKINELKALCDTLGATCVIFDHDLSPRQIAKIEEAVERKILDRSELILDIFASRATTHEAKLQVELAQLEYTYPRLRAMWSHLERITGGSPGGVGTRGPGEQQLEIDRRLVQRRKKLLTDELHDIQARKRRAVANRKIDHFTVGLVGYTNAGKSTLFNTLTEGGAYADDRLFATLMTRTRQWDMGGGLACMLSDTVGFVRDLPHHLVASFRATLEEATHADLLLIVLDVSDPAAEMHLKTVHDTLDELVADVEAIERKEAEAAKRSGGSVIPYVPPERVVLLNKTDLLPDNRELLLWQTRAPGSIPISALTGPDGQMATGHDEVVQRVKRAMIGDPLKLAITVPLADAKTIHTIENRATVHDREYDADRVTLRVTIGDRQLARLRSAGARMTLATPEGQPVDASLGGPDANDWA